MEIFICKGEKIKKRPLGGPGRHGFAEGYGLLSQAGCVERLCKKVV